MNLRSVLQIMTFLSKGVCVPDDHVISGIAPVTPDPDGQPFDWTGVTAGNFVVHAQKAPTPRTPRWPSRTVATGSISPVDDVKSRAVLAILEILFALQESGERSRRPGAHPAGWEVNRASDRDHR